MRHCCQYLRSCAKCLLSYRQLVWLVWLHWILSIVTKGQLWNFGYWSGQMQILSVVHFYVLHQIGPQASVKVLSVLYLEILLDSVHTGCHFDSRKIWRREVSLKSGQCSGGFLWGGWKGRCFLKNCCVWELNGTVVVLWTELSKWTGLKRRARISARTLMLLKRLWGKHCVSFSN